MKFLVFAAVFFSSWSHAVDTFPAQPQLPDPDKPAVEKADAEKRAAKKTEKTKAREEKAEKEKSSAAAKEPADVSPTHEAPPPTQPNWFMRNRSSPDALFWVGGNGSIVVHDAGTGAGLQLNLRLKLGRCAILADWHTQNISISDPGDVYNNIVGLGTMCTIATFGEYHRGVRGAHLAASLLMDYGRTRYHLYDHASYSSSQRELTAGTDTSFGGTTGVDFYFPILFGFWVNAGLGYEKMYFNYDLSNVRGTTSHVPNEMGYFRVGLSYGI